MHTTIPKGIVGGFVCPVLQRNLKEWHARPRTYVRECWWKATKEGSTTTVVRNSVLIISHIAFRDCRVHIFRTTFLEIAVYSKSHKKYMDDGLLRTLRPDLKIFLITVCFFWPCGSRVVRPTDSYPALFGLKLCNCFMMERAVFLCFSFDKPC